MLIPLNKALKVFYKDPIESFQLKEKPDVSNIWIKKWCYDENGWSYR